MAMTKKDFQAIAETIAAMKPIAQGSTMTLEEFRQQIGKELMNDCQRAYSGGYGFDTDRFRRVAELDD